MPAPLDDSAATIRQLVAACLERLDAEGPGAIDLVCAEHPEHAAVIRRRVATLDASGLLDRGRAAAPALHLPGFRIGRRLGGGGMGVVYLAEDESLGRQVAIKLIRPELLHVERARRRFAREAEAAARLHHPGIVPVHSVGEHQGTPYLVMEYVEGVTLAEVLERLQERAPASLTAKHLAQAVHAESRHPGQPAPTPGADRDSGSSLFEGSWVDTVVRIGRRAAEALDHAHAHGVVHRDVKPSNLMITPAGRVLLLDFGLARAEGDARLTATGTHLGSLAYMSPEQLRGRCDELDTSSDVYGLGVTLYEMLALRPPYQGATHDAIRQQILAGEAPPLRTIHPGLRADVVTVVQVAMERDAGRRYRSAAALRDDLTNLIERRPITVQPPGVWIRARRWCERHPARAVAAVALGLALVGGPLTYAWIERAANRRVRLALADAQENLDSARNAVHAMTAIAEDDLRDVPGMERVRGRILEEALGFHRAFVARADDPEIRRDAARAAHRAGHIQLELGELVAARESLEAAAGLARRRLEVAPRDLDALESLARAETNLSDAAFELGEVAGAEQHVAEAAGAWRRHGEAAADPAPSRRGLAELHARRALRLGQGGDSDLALAAHLDCVRLHEEIRAADPADGAACAKLGYALVNLGVARGKRRESAESEQALRRALELLGPAPDAALESLVTTIARGLAHVYLGRTLLAGGRPEPARENLELGVAQLRRVHEAFPGFGKTRQALSVGCGTLAGLERAAGRFDQAAALYAEAADLIRDMRGDVADAPRHDADLGIVLLARAIALRGAGRLSAARQCLDEAIACQTRVLAGAPARTDWSRALFNQLYTRALISLQRGDLAAVAADALRMSTMASSRGADLYVVAGLLARSAGQTEDAAVAEARAELALAALRRAIDTGWWDAQALATSSHLDAIRARPGYRELVDRGPATPTRGADPSRDGR